MRMGRAEPGVGRPLGLGRLSLRDSEGVMIRPWEILFSLLSFFPVLRLDQLFLVVEATRGRAVAERPNVFITFLARQVLTRMVNQIYGSLER